MSRSVKSEIDRRTTDASKLAALEARKVAILEMVAGLMQEAVDLLRNEGFTAGERNIERAVTMVAPQPPAPQGVTVVHEAQLAPAPQIKNPCAMCGQEAVGTENLAGGGKKYLCAVHYKARLAEKQEEETTKQLMGSAGTLYTRPTVPQAPVKKIIIQADPLLGTANVSNGSPTPPPNNVLDDND